MNRKLMNDMKTILNALEEKLEEDLSNLEDEHIVLSNMIDTIREILDSGNTEFETPWRSTQQKALIELGLAKKIDEQNKYCGIYNILKEC